MVSPRSATNGDLRTPPPDQALLQEALREGARFAETGEPTPLHHAAAYLEQLGFLERKPQEYVICRHELDPDYRFSREGCRARIYLRADLDEEDGDYRCPACHRPVWPSRKQRFTETVLCRDDDVIAGWLGDRLRSIAKVQAKEAGVWRLITDDNVVQIVLIEICEEHSECFGETWARANQVLYVAIDPEWAAHHAVDWLRPVSIASFIGSDEALREALAQAPDRQAKTRVAEDTRIYSSGRPPVRFEVDDAPVKGRTFSLTLGEEQLLINGEVMLNRQAAAQMQALRVMVEWYLEDLAAFVPANEFRWLTLAEIAEGIAKKTKAKEALDNMTVRRQINRLQSDLADKWRKNVGSAIDDHDLVQTSKGGSGYRINPFTVVIRPFAW